MDIRSLIAGVVVGAVIALILDNAWVRLHLARIMPGGEERDALRHAQEAQLRAVSRAEQLELELEEARNASALVSAAPLLSADQETKLAGFDALTSERDRLAQELVSARNDLAAAITSNNEQLAALQAKLAELESKPAAAPVDTRELDLLQAKHNETLQELETFRAKSAAERAAHAAELETLRTSLKAAETAPKAEPAISDAELVRLKERADLGASLAVKTEQLLAERDALANQLAAVQQRSAEPTDASGIKERLIAMSQESAAIKRSLASAYAQIETMKVKLAGTAKSDLTRVPGLSADHASKLSDSGIRTYDDLARARTESLLDILELSDAEHVLARSWQDEARKLADRGDH